MEAELRTWLASLQMGDAQTYKNVTVFSLIAPGNGAPTYRTLSEALDDHSLTVTEASQAGRVPELKVVNQAKLPVLLIDGEELIGAKQNRVLNTSILLKESSETIIPVSCTEQGRWAYASVAFADAGVVMAHSSRAHKAHSVSDHLAGGAHFTSDQAAVWQRIADLHAKAHTSSPTGALHDVFTARQADLEACLKALPAVANHQNGLLVLINGAVAGFDLVSRPAAYARLHAKLLKSYVIEALVEPRPVTIEAEQALERATSFLDEVLQCEERRFPSVGYGVDARFRKAGLAGMALIHESRVVHCAFFRLSAEDERGRMAARCRWRGHA